VSRAVVGVDASISSTGVVLLSDKVRAFKRVQTKPRGEEIGARIDRIRQSAAGIRNAIDGEIVGGGLDVQLVVIEMPAFGKSTAMTHMLAGHWWMTVHVLEQLAPVAQVAPGTLKKFATGNGRAEKDEVLAAAIGVFATAIRNNDVADASVLAAMGATHLGIEFGGGFAPSGVASVQSVRWPELRGSN
jgi:crossover junction endodeoxyribonuclease RuvC